MHRDDGWEPPPGFDEWLAEWHTKDFGSDKSKQPLASSLKRRCGDLWPPSRRRRVSDEHDHSKWVWRPCNALSDADLDHFLAEVNASEDVALRALYEANYDIDQARRALGAAPCNANIDTTSHSEQSYAMASFAAACSLIAGIEEPAPTLRLEQSRRRRRRQWTDDDVHRFGEAMLECDRDCRAALKKLRRRDNFSNAHLADVLDLYYGIFKARGQHYSEWKARLISRRGPRDAHASSRPRLKNVVAKKSTPHPPPPPLPLPPQEEDKETEGLVFACPCGCGALVDNRGRPASHRRKWATRSCRDRAARKGADDLCDSPPDEDVVFCLCGCGETVDNRGRPSSHRKKWASAACRQRAHSERAKELRRVAAESHTTPTVAKPTLVHAGVVVAMGRECAVVEQRTTGGRWLVRFTGGPRDGERQEILALDIAVLLLRDVPCAADAMTFRGVTRKYGECPRYNAAFSLLGDRFSLGSFESAARAARAWDVIAWTSGRDDLNVSDFLPPKPKPTRAELHMLAKYLRDAMRLRTCPVADLSKCGVEVDAVPRGATSNAQVVHVCIETQVVAPRGLPPTTSTTTSLSLPRLLFAACLERLADDNFAVGLGAAVASRGRVLVVTARLSRRWLVECFERSSAGDDNLLVEMSADALEAVGSASFALLSRGRIDAADSPDTVAAVIRFMKAQFVDKRLSDGRIKILDVVPEASRLVVKATDLVNDSLLDLELHECSRDLLANHRATCTRLLLTPPKDDSAKHAIANVLLPPLPVA